MHCNNYIIQRSEDGTTFTEIGKVKNKENNNGTDNDYLFKDESPVKGISYYRLKQNNHDGSFEYSIINEINFEFEEKVTIYNQSVFNDNLSFNIESGSRKKLDLELYNAAGQRIFSGQVEINPGKTNCDIPLTSVAGGVYMLKVSSGQEVIIKKVIA